MPTHRAAPVLLTLALLGGTAACGSEGDGRATEPPAASSTPAPSPEEDAPPFPTRVRPSDGGYGSGNGLGLTGVTTSQGDGYDRVVLELGGTGTVGWYVDYVRRPVADGSGEPVPLEGEVFLQVVLRGLGLPFDTGLEEFGDDTTRIPGAGTRGVAEVAPGGVFEGDQAAFVGLSGPRRPFRVFTLSDPTRLVVDVLHE